MALASRLNPEYGKGSAKLSEPGEPDDLLAKLTATYRSSSYEPPLLPAAALELVQLSRDPNVEFEKIRSVIESEPLLAAKVVKLAQSAFYSNGSQILSLEDAMVRLGLLTLTDLFLQASMNTRVFRTKGYEAPLENLRRHSVLTAHLARVICRRTSLPDEYAFLCGLLHDVGLAAGLILVADVPRGQSPPPLSEVWQAVKATHEEAASVLAQAWKLPPDIALVLSHHHCHRIQGRPHPLAAAVCLADNLAARVGAGPDDEADPAQGKLAAEDLGLSSNDVVALQEQAKDILANME